ncbi:MAG: hypothetical protein PVH79_00365 [Candidatus Bathyarchaeota archaeon]|jgi:predicted nucleic-acid-binding Zn-ribbon protein
MEEIESSLCPKCGGSMIKGRIIVPIERLSTPEMGQLTPGFMRNSLPPIVENFTTVPHWEEKTGEKTGLIFKKDKVRQMRIRAQRCTVCNYVELYAQGD